MAGTLRTSLIDESCTYDILGTSATCTRWTDPRTERMTVRYVQGEEPSALTVRQMMAQAVEQ